MSEKNKQQYRFTEAPIWDIQRAYYEQEGLRAWNKNEVPQYITCNPQIATAYAEMIFGMLQDTKNVTDPVHIVELGAGSGRLGFQIIEELNLLISYAQMPLPPFKYIITDYAHSNVETWIKHEALQSYIKQGIVDFARFDAVNDTELKLAIAGETLGAGSLKQPMAIVANYFFDSIPQELLYIGDDGIYELDVEIEYPANHEDIKPSQLLKELKLDYIYKAAPQYGQADFKYADTMAFYKSELEDSHVLFPIAALTCLERLNAIAPAGFVLITADKGDHLAEYFKFTEAPSLVFHGSFSLTANYHAIAHAYINQGALSLFPEQHYHNINVGCIIHVPKPEQSYQTRLAYRRCIERFGPDEFFSLKETVDANIDTMQIRQLLAFWRLGRYDMEFFLQSSKRISTLLVDATDGEKEDLYVGIHSMYVKYYVIEKHYTVALEAGLLLFEIDRYEESKQFLEQWISEDPVDIDSAVYYCLAVCCFELELEDEAVIYLKKLVELEPNHEEAVALLSSLEE